MLETVKNLVERVRSARRRGAPIIGDPHRRDRPVPAIGVWGHWSNDNYAPGEEMMGQTASGSPLFAGRAWLHFGASFTDSWTADAQWQIGSKATLCLAALSVSPVEGGVDVSLGLPGVVYLNVGLDGWPKEFYDRLGIGESYEPHAIEVAYHHDSIWWRLWAPTMSWTSGTPKWRDGNVDFAELFFGNTEMTEEVINTQRVEVPMPEGVYPATLRMLRRTWRRPRARWVTNQGIFADIQIDSPGIPIPGKGTCAHNCGDDAVHSLSLPSKSPEHAIGYLVDNVLARRARYGGSHRYTEA